MPKQFPIQMKNYDYAVKQWTIGMYELTFNPDDSRWHINKQNEVRTLASFKGTPKGYDNAIQWIKRKNKERRRD